MWYTDPVSNDSDSLEKAKKDICEAFTDYSCEKFTLKYIVIATWDRVGYFKEQNNKVRFSVAP